MRGKSAQHMSIIGTKNDWGTPKEDFKEACKKFEITPKLDVCASKQNKMCKNYFGYDHIVRSKKDGLAKDWNQDFFMNPPYDPEYQCNECGSINSFDWQYIFENKQDANNLDEIFLTDMGNQTVKLKDMDTSGFKMQRKRLLCKACKAGSSHRETLHKGVTDWLKKAYSEHLNNNVNALILTFAKTDTKWWHKYVENKAEVHFIQGRIRFLDKGTVSDYPAPYGSCWIIYRAKK